MAGSELVAGEGRGRPLEEHLDKFEALEGGSVGWIVEVADEGRYGGGIDHKIKKPPELPGGFELNRATSYSPTQLPVQYHRG